MFINRVLYYYYRAYYAAARGNERGRGVLGIFKKTINAQQRGALYQWIKKWTLSLGAGFLYWPSTFPTSIDEPTAVFLYSLVRLARPQIAFEIGTYKGNAAIAIGQGLEDNGAGILHTIDPFEQDIVHIAIRKSGLQNRIRYHIGYSYDVMSRFAEQKIDFVFIDGDHAYESVRRDFNLIAGRIPQGGMVIFHDALVSAADGFDGPRRIIEELKNSSEWEVAVYSTEVGTDVSHNVVLQGDVHPFFPVGIAVCIKK